MVFLPFFPRFFVIFHLFLLFFIITLNVLHNFYWNDITLGVEGAGSKNISYRVKQILPLMMKVKEMFEDEINKEFPAHISEKEFFQSIRRN